MTFRGHIEIPKIYKLNMSRIWFKKVQNWECVVVDRNIKKIRMLTKCLKFVSERKSILMKIRHCREQYKALVGQRCIWLASSTWWCEMIELVTGR